jgi:uncharacterized DUF497 family protein
MIGPKFTWDERKDTATLRKHGVTFAEAATAFADENGLLLDDPDHSEKEERFVLLGLSCSPRLLVVVHAYREPEDEIRIISARHATRQEERTYLRR